MQVNVGDLVQCRTRGEKIGIVVDRRISNEGLNKSMHVQHMINNYPKVYYVFFSDEGRSGPYYETDLKLQQVRQTTSNIDL